MYGLENIRPNHLVHIRLHELKNQVNVLVILCFQHIKQSNHILMCHFLQKHNLTEGTLGVSVVLKS